MGIPTFRFRLSHPSEGTKTISEPDGWKAAKLKLERHPDFHSLVEYFEGDFIFYGSNGVQDGGINFILAVENKYGPDAEIIITIDLSLDEGIDYENVFTGVLDLSALQHLKNNKLSCPIIRSSFWTKFISRKETPVNIQSTTDLDGNTKSVIDDVTLNLLSQKVRYIYSGLQDPNATLTYDIPDNQYGIIDFAEEPIKEIKEKFFLPRVESATRPNPLFTVEYGGNYNFDIEIRVSTAVFFGSGTDTNLQVRLQINDNAATVLTQTGESGGLDAWTNHNYSGDITLVKGDEIRLYFYNNNATGASYQFIWFAGILQDSHLYIEADTVYPDTTAEAYLIHDVGQSIVERITSGSFYSEYLGSTLTNGRVYGADGCQWNNVLIQGLQVRGYTLSDKRFSLSFDKWWKGANPIFNLGLGYETVTDTGPVTTDVIRVENKAHFYDKASAPSIYIDNVFEIIREYDNSRIFKKIEIGYQKWQSEDISGLDDPQTKHTYATSMQKIGTDLVLYSEFMAASVAIEVTRRQTIEKSKDYKLDNDIFIIHILPTVYSGADNYAPDTDQYFNAVTGLLNSDTRYNILLSPKRNLLRWTNYIIGCLQKQLSTSLKFMYGEGNYDMASDYDCSNPSCIGVICDNISEKDNLELSTYGPFIGFLHLPEIYNIEIDMSWEDYATIRSNRKKTIGISQTTTGHKKFFIKELEYEICKSKCKLQVWPAEPFQISVIS